MSRRKNKDDSRRFFDWIDKAEEDLAAAKLLKNDETTTKLSAFHCQQCIEKVLKGYILFHSEKLVDGHNLTWLCRSAARYNRRLESYVIDSIMLNKYYIETRYPTDIDFEITKQDAEGIVRMAETIYQSVRTEVEKLWEEIDREE